MIKFRSPFATLLTEFIELKRRTGFKYITEAKHLLQFDSFCLDQGVTIPHLTKSLSDLWCSKKPYESARNSHQQRVSCIRQFALYLVAMGYDAHIPVNLDYIRQRKSAYMAYIFSHSEMNSIFAKSNQIYPHRRSTMHLVMPVLVRLLYSSGLRIQEALDLTLQDLDLVNGVLQVRRAKFNKDRHIPVSETMLEILREYCSVMHPRYLSNDPLFVGVTRQPYSHHSIYTRFRELLVQAGIQHAGRGYGPRIHDVRHTFCCHTLQRAVKSGADLSNMLPLLSEYMGHESWISTSQYVKMTAEVYPEILEAVTRMCAFVIPEVKP